jgi:hypothetical protein
LGFQAIEDFFRRGIARRPTMRVKIGHYLDQPINPDLAIIGEFQYPLTNCRRFGFASGDSANHFKLWHIAPPFRLMKTMFTAKAPRPQRNLFFIKSGESDFMKSCRLVRIA